MDDKIFNPFTLVEYRLLEQGRADCSDGYNWLRCLIGSLCIACLAILVVTVLPQNKTAVATALFVSFLGLFVVVAWICKSDNRAKKSRLAELKKAYDTE